jgi:3-methyladenine DNA glycosylase AlkD
MTIKVGDIRAELQALTNPEIAAHSQGFFKTGKGEYAEGDKFLGVRVPVLRTMAKKHQQAPQKVVLSLLKSPAHEERLLALLVLVGKFQAGSDAEKRAIYRLYIDNKQHVNNWDLVDSCAYKSSASSSKNETSSHFTPWQNPAICGPVELRSLPR